MDLLLLAKALILGVVEGLTEFLPISSTGHLILVGDLLNFNDERGKAFEVVIQFGAVLAVCWEYRRKLWAVISTLGSSQPSRRFVKNLLIASFPAMEHALFFGLNGASCPEIPLVRNRLETSTAWTIWNRWTP